jgi:hypothetical protein
MQIRWLLISLLLLTGCPQRSPKPQVTVVTAPSSQPATPTPPPPRRVHFKLEPAQTKAKPFSVGETKHEVSAELIRLEVLDDPDDLDDEALHPKTRAEMKQAGDGSFLVCVLDVKVDGKPLSDPSVKGTFRSVGMEFSYGGRTYNSVRGYVGPAKGRPDAQLHVTALEAVRGDGEWVVIQSLYLADGTRLQLEFKGEVKLPKAG